MEETLGKRIMAHRKRLGLTQDQLAEKLGVTAQAVSKWENDQSCPDITMLPKLAELFGTTTDALLGCEPVFEAQVVPEPAQEDDRQEDQSWSIHVDDAQNEQGWSVHWDAGRRGGLTFGIFVLLVGALMLASELLGWEVGFWSLLWPSALLVFGFSSMVHRFRFTNLLCTLLGAYFLANNVGKLPFSLDKNLVLPGLVVIFGISLLVDALRKPKKPRFHVHKKGKNGEMKSSFQQEGERFSTELSFGDATRQVSLPRLSGGQASVSFGELVVDLTGCGEIVDGCTIEASVSFGEMTIRVPRYCQVQTACGTSFGSTEYVGHPDPNPKATLYITGGASFGGLNIQYV